jgi:hypothetical protein
MRVGGEPVGRWGLAVMTVTGIAGLLLALHGWSARAAGAAPPLGAGAVSGRGGAPTAASPPHSSVPSAPATATPSAPATGPAGSAGPLLSSEPFAKASFQVWPGPVSSAAKLALTGLTVTVHKRTSGLSVTAGVAGQGSGSTKLYVDGARVYIVEASLGDDSGNADYNLGDDGLVVTDAQGRIIQ